MKLYSDHPVQRARHLLGDIGLIAWAGLCTLAGIAVFHVTMLLAVPVRSAAKAGDSMAANLYDLGGTIKKVPLVGGDLQAPVRSVGDQAATLARTSRETVTSIHNLAIVLGIVVAAVPIVFALALWLPRRIAFVRRAAAAQRLVDADADLRLFALRAMARQPLPLLDKVSHDPVAAWLAADPVITRQLAVLELRQAGLRPPS